MAELSKRIFTCSALGLAAVLVIALFFAGCVQQPGGSQATPTQPGGQATIPPTKVTVLRISGSTTVLPIAEKAADAYMNDHAMTDIQVAGGGSSVGVQAIGEKTVDIGMSSRELKDIEKALRQTIICYDGIVVVVNPRNPIRSLTLQQVRDIFSGNITNWKQLGWTDRRIDAVTREEGSGTRGAFEASGNFFAS